MRCADALKGNLVIPKVLSDILVTGVFETYEEDGQMYCQLSDAEVVETQTG